MVNRVRKEIFYLQDLKYKDFHSALCPGINNIIGVRVPDIRKLVKSLIKEDYKYYLDNVENKYYEETMIEGLIIVTSKMDLSEKFKYLDIFVPKIDNWAICDIVCSSFKVKKKELDLVWKYTLSYKNSNSEYELRFMIVMMMDYFITTDYANDVLNIIDNLNTDYYYVNMAIAWLISVLFVKNKKLALSYLNSNNLNDFTYNKSLQKIIESNRVSKEDKDMCREMKRR